jgi:hypothetical protein
MSDDQMSITLLISLRFCGQKLLFSLMKRLSRISTEKDTLPTAEGNPISRRSDFQKWNADDADTRKFSQI